MKRINKSSFALIGKALTERGQLVNLLGNGLFRWGSRITAGAAFVGSLGYALHSFGELLGKDLGGFTLKEALNLPKATGLFLLLPGAIGKYGPLILSSNIHDASQAESLNSMQEWRRKNTLEHLVSLWQRVFEPEARIRYTAKYISHEEEKFNEQQKGLRELMKSSLKNGEKEFLGISGDESFERVIEGMVSANPFSEKLEASLGGFLASSMYALKNSKSRLASEQEIGYGIWQLLNWYDGAPLDQSDKKTREIYFGDRSLRKIRRELAHFPSFPFPKLKSFPGILKQNIVFSYVVKMLAADALKTSRQFNYDYMTNKPVSQTWLFPRDEELEIFSHLSPREKDSKPAKEEFIRRRAQMIRRRFGDTLEDAESVIDQMVLPSFDRASRDRLAYDAEYIDHPGFRPEYAIKYCFEDDLESVGCCDKDSHLCKKGIQKPRRELVLFTKYLRGNYPGLFDFENSETLRALRTNFHIDKYEMKTEFKNRLKRLKDINASQKEVSMQVGENYRRNLLHNYVGRARTEKREVTEKLQALRTHHTITMLEIEDYRTLLYELAYSNSIEEVLRKE